MFFSKFSEKKIISQKLQNIGALNFDHLFHIYNGQIDQILEAIASVLFEKIFFSETLYFCDRLNIPPQCCSQALSTSRSAARGTQSLD